jgi:hypothetical protein
MTWRIVGQDMSPTKSKNTIRVNYRRGSSPIFLLDSMSSGGSIGLIRQKKGTITQKPTFNHNPNSSNLVEIGDQPSHGGDPTESTSSDVMSTMKCSHHRISYSLGSTIP